MKANADLTTTYSELSDAVASLIKANKQLSCRVGNHCNNRTCKGSTVPHPKKMCPHYNTEVMHAPHNCFELEKTLPDALGGGQVVCDNGGHLK